MADKVTSEAQGAVSPRYDHASVEKKWIARWEELSAFGPDFSKPDPALPPFSIVIPPPNVTGELHVGHALDQTIQDVLIRYYRKKGRRTLWLPGTDHAGIATQVKVEQRLKSEGKTRHDLGREKFIEAVWNWKEEFGGAITKQQRLMGFSLDWSRERFTMDKGLSAAVRKVFVDLYEEGLIYRDTRLVNWDPVAGTVLSDLEVEFEENYEGELYEFAYKLDKEFQRDGLDEIVVATTRPETMLGDTAIAVHPEDERFSHLIGKSVRHPFVERSIPILADAELVDMEFGTGAVKVTPAHDPNDYEVGKRHNLEFINIFDKKACINENGGEFAGLERYEARKKIKEALQKLGLERGSKRHLMSVGRSQRSGAIVEPLISTQWFVKIGPLAEPAIEAVESGRIRFVPAQWEKTYFHWMRGIRDWCISRQLWWGHRIPAWYGPDETVFVAHNESQAQEKAKKHYGKKVELRQDEDVLDTWFSSALWPFSTLGWPEDTEDLRTYYPTSVLVTGFDIIFFWVARMIMQGLHFMKAPPFHEVYIHGLMRDAHGKKMSKTTGNVVDPLEVIPKYGADAFRFFLMATLSEGKDSLYSEQRLKGYQNFCNKIWNSARFVLMNLPDNFSPIDKSASPSQTMPNSHPLLALALEAEDYWILSELSGLAKTLEENLRDYKFHLASEALYNFTWRYFCDWYIEFIKPRLFGKLSEDSAEAARQVVYFTLRNLLSLLSPFTPFIAEELNEKLGAFSPAKQGEQTKHAQKKKGTLRHLSEELVVSARFETLPAIPKDAEGDVEGLRLLQELIGAVRGIRAEMGIAPDKKLGLVLATKNAALLRLCQTKAGAIERLAKIESIRMEANYKGSRFDATAAFSQGTVFVPLEGILDMEKEKQRLKAESEKLKKALLGIQKKLANKKFIENAPAEVVAKEQKKQAELEEKLLSTRNALERFGGQTK